MNVNNSSTEGPSQLPLTEKLFHISMDLGEDETHKIKFLLKDNLPKSNLSTKTEVRSVFQCLQNKMLVQESKPQLIVELLSLVGRSDLSRKYFPNSEGQRSMDILSTFRLELFKVATGLCDKDKKLLIDVVPGIPKSEAEKMATPFDVIKYLEETTVITEDDTTQLQAALDKIGRKDKAKELLVYHGGIPIEVADTTAQQCSSMSSLYSLETASTTQGKMKANDAFLLAKATLSVGIIGDGTGFRVGSKYIMTASHVIKMALGFQRCERVTIREIQSQLDKQGLSIRFKFAEPHLNDHKPWIVPLQRIIVYNDVPAEVYDELFDVTIAELKEVRVPDPILLFFDNYPTSASVEMTFLGHDGGCQDPEFGFSLSLTPDELRDIGNAISQPRPDLQLICQRMCNDPNRVQLKGPFKNGASGSPGVVIRDGKVKLFALLTHGNFEEEGIPEHLRVQEGTRMWLIKEMLKSTGRNEDIVLCEDIFRGWDIQEHV